MSKVDEKKWEDKGRENAEKILAEPAHNEIAMRMLKRDTTTTVTFSILLSYFTGLLITVLLSSPIEWYDIVFIVILFVSYIVTLFALNKLIRSSLDLAESSGQVEAMRKAKRAIEEANREYNKEQKAKAKK